MIIVLFDKTKLCYYISFLRTFQMNAFETPLTGLSTPPSHERMGEEARRRLFLRNEEMLAAMQPYVTRLNFSHDEIQTSTPNSTIVLGSSPWTSMTTNTSLNLSELNELLPPMEGPSAQNVPSFNDQQGDLSFTELSTTSRLPTLDKFPEEVRAELRAKEAEDPDASFLVVVSTVQTFKIIKQ